MRKRITLLSLMVGMFISLSIPTMATSSKAIKLVIDNVPITANENTGQIYMTNNRTLVPIRVVTENMGFKVDWNNKTQKVTISNADREIILTIGSKTALVNGKEVQMDVTAAVKNGRTYVPIRFVSENLGATVVWDDATSTVFITTTTQVTTVSLTDFINANDALMEQLRFLANKDGKLDARLTSVGNFTLTTPVNENIKIVDMFWGSDLKQDIVVRFTGSCDSAPFRVVGVKDGKTTPIISSGGVSTVNGNQFIRVNIREYLSTYKNADYLGFFTTKGGVIEFIPVTDMPIKNIYTY